MMFGFNLPDLNQVSRHHIFVFLYPINPIRKN
jgi:hypothetical protein